MIAELPEHEPDTIDDFYENFIKIKNKNIHI